MGTLLTVLQVSLLLAATVLSRDSAAGSTLASYYSPGSVQTFEALPIEGCDLRLLVVVTPPLYPNRPVACCPPAVADYWIRERDGTLRKVGTSLLGASLDSSAAAGRYFNDDLGIIRSALEQSTRDCGSEVQDDALWNAFATIASFSDPHAVTWRWLDHKTAVHAKTGLETKSLAELDRFITERAREFEKGVRIETRCAAASFAGDKASDVICWRFRFEWRQWTGYEVVYHARLPLPA